MRYDFIEGSQASASGQKYLCGFDVTAVSVVIEAIVCMCIKLYSASGLHWAYDIKTTQILLTTCNFWLEISL